MGRKTESMDQRRHGLLRWERASLQADGTAMGGHPEPASSRRM